MNKRQWQVLAVGTAATLLVPVVCAKRYNPPVLIGSPVTFHSGPHAGQTAQTMLNGSIPMWAIGALLGLAVLTGVAVYKGRTQHTA